MELPLDSRLVMANENGVTPLAALIGAGVPAATEVGLTTAVFGRTSPGPCRGRHRHCNR